MYQWGTGMLVPQVFDNLMPRGQLHHTGCFQASHTDLQGCEGILCRPHHVGSARYFSAQNGVCVCVLHTEYLSARHQDRLRHNCEAGNNLPRVHVQAIAADHKTFVRTSQVTQVVCSMCKV